MTRAQNVIAKELISSPLLQSYENYELHSTVMRELLLSCSSGILLSGSTEQPATYGYDQLTFSCFQLLQRRELPSQAVLDQPTGVSLNTCLLIGGLQVRILFEEPNALEVSSGAFLYLGELL